MSKLYLLHNSKMTVSKLIFTSETLKTTDFIKQFNESFKNVKLTILSLDIKNICELSTLTDDEMEFLELEKPINAVVFKNSKSKPIKELITYFENSITLDCDDEDDKIEVKI